MSWAKQSADAGLAGLCEWEAARGVMGEEVDVDLPNVPEEKFIKVVSNFNFRSLKKMTGIGLRQCWIPLGTKRPTNPSLWQVH